MPKDRISSIVFEGGSVKGAAYPGAIDALIALDVLDINHVRRFAGTSAGSITAALMSVGYIDPVEFRQLLVGEDSIDFTRLMPAGEIFKIQESIQTLKKKPETSFSSRMFTQPAKKTAAASNASTAVTSATYKLFNSACLIDGEFLREFIERMISEKVKTILRRKKTEQGADYHGPVNPDIFCQYITFGMLHDLAGLYPAEFKDLYVVSYSLSEQRGVTFSHEDPEWQNLVVSDGVRMSVSIPFLFAPHTPHYRDVGADGNPIRVKGEVCPLFIDGGVDSNFPLHLFDDYQYYSQREDGQDGYFVNPETLGFSLLDPAKMNYLKTGQSDIDQSGLSSAAFFPLILSVIHAYKGKQKRAHIESEQHTQRTVHINTLGIGMLDIQIGSVQKWALFESGRQAVFKKFGDGQVFTSHPDNPHSRFTQQMLLDANREPEASHDAGEGPADAPQKAMLP